MNRRENQTHQQSTYDIYVGNVPKNLTETELKQVFVNYGEIKQVLCRWKEDCNGVGYGIVKFVFKMDAERLLQETDEVSWNGHPLPIKAARRSDQNQQNGNIVVENKVNCYSDFNPKPLLVNPPFLKGGSAPRIFCPPSVPFSSNPMKRSADDFGFMPVSNLDIGYYPNTNYPENQPVHSVPINLEVLCTNVEDAITFYGCPVHRFEELANVTRALASLNLVPNKVDRKPLLKKVYAALFSEDRSWYRCVVTRPTLPNRPGMCTVRYIDYGNQEDISYKNISELPESLQNVPAFASKFVFSNLMCESKANKQTYLHQLTNKRMSLCAIQSSNADYQVSKCSCNGKDIISETVKKGFAFVKKVAPKSGTPKPLGAKASSKLNEIHENKKNKATVCNGQNGYEEHGSPDDTKNSKNNRKVVLKNKDNLKNETKKEELGLMNDHPEDPDFHPKMIIKRGSILSDLVGSKDTVELKKEKEQKQQSSHITMDGVISNLKLINNIRTLVSQSTDDSTIQYAIELLQNENLMYEVPEDLIKSIDEAHKNFIQAIEEIKKCSDKSALDDLKSDRDLKQNLLCEKLKEFLKQFDLSLLSRKNKIMQTIIDLASNSNDWMNVELKAKPSSLQELVVEYNKVKEEKWSLVKKARDRTNQKHATFMEVFASVQKEFYLNTLENNCCKGDTLNINNETKRLSYSAKFEETLRELGEAVEQEIRTVTLKKEKDSVSIIQCLSSELDIHKEKVESVCELYESKLSLYNELCQVINLSELLLDLAVIQEGVCTTLLRLTHCKDSNEEDKMSSNSELHSVLRSLHVFLLKEDKIVETLAKAAEKFLPELCIEHPDLKLSEYSTNDYLLKFNWKPEYFLNLESSKGNSSYVSKIMDNPIIIKEYKHETQEELEKFIKVAVVWNRCRCEYLLKIQALFFKEDHSISAICPYVTGALLENPPAPIPVEGEKACNILRQLLICLKELHSQRLIYGAVHPSSILIENGKVLLDFCFFPKVLESEMVLKGINFLPPAEEVSERSGDMYGFGCLVLWLLFPNLSFNSTEEGVPNLTAFRSIIEEALTTKDYALLCSLLSSKQKSRPSASFLLSKGFLANYESYCRARNKAISGS